MVSRYRHRRTSNPATAFPNPIEPGELVTNTANRQLVVGDANSGSLGAPVVLIAVRYFDVRAKYAIDDLVQYQSNIFRARTANGPGAFNASNWSQITYPDADVNLVQAGGDTMTGPLILAAGEPSAPTAAAPKSYVDAADALKADKTYVDAADAAKVAKVGDTMSGHLSLPTGPAAANAVRKDYVDAADALKADKTYVDAADALKADKTYVDTQDALKADKTYVDAADALKAPLASPVFTGDPQAPTAANTDNDTSIATTAFVKAVLAAGTYTTAIADGAVSTTAKLADGIVTFVKMAATAIATSAEYLSNTASKLLTTDKVWTAAGINPTVTDAATVNLDFSLGINFYWGLTAAGRTLGSPTNQKPGQCGIIRFGVQNAGASVTGWASDWKFPGGVKPTTTVTTGAIDMMSYYVAAVGTIYCSFMADVK